VIKLLGRGIRPGTPYMVITYLSNNGGKTKVSVGNLSKEWGLTNQSVSHALKKLVKEGLIVVTSPAVTPTGKCVAAEYAFTEDGESFVSQLSKSKGHVPLRRKIINNSTALKLSITRELVQAYEKLKEFQELNVRLQSENKNLQDEKRALKLSIKKLQEELDEEKISAHQAATEISLLELQLRELKSEADPRAHRILFDRSGVQA